MAHAVLDIRFAGDYLRISELALKRYGFKLADRGNKHAYQMIRQRSEDYCKAMSCALNFAWCNRQMITHWTRKAFERIFGMNEHTLNMQLVYDVSHNIAKVERHRIDGEGMRDLVIHRKGATRSFLEEQQLPAQYNGIGQPVIIRIYGDSQLGTLGNKKSSDLSLDLAHGAGRTMSRSAAKTETILWGSRSSLETKESM